MELIQTAEQAAATDRAADEPVEVLMDRAGLGVALAAVDLGAGYGSLVTVLAGPGNNGGDGYVAASYLRERGVAVEVLELAPPKSEACAWAARVARDSGVPISGWRPPRNPDLVIDALFGGGFHGELPAELAPWVDVAAPVVSVDVPSGVNASDGTVAEGTLYADLTVTFETLKVAHVIGVARDHCGTVEVFSIGLSPGEAELLLCQEEDAPLPVRERLAHKWSAGSVLVVGGSEGLTGAPILASEAALVAGAGAVRVVLPGAAGGRVPAHIMERRAGSRSSFEASEAGSVLEEQLRFDVLALGPGLGSDQEAFVADLLDGWEGTIVLDADGIGAVTPDILRARKGPTVLTPHAGEFARLAGVDASYRAAQELAGSTGTEVVLKGAPTIVAGPETWVIANGGPELATIGTGDVLTGMIAAFLAAGIPPAPAARSAAYWHASAGAELARSTVVTADRLVDEIGRLLA